MKSVDFPNQAVIGVVLDTKLQKEDILALDIVVKKKLEKFTGIGVYVEMESFKGMTFAAFVEDLKAFFPKIKNFKKKAVVSPKSTLTEIGGIVAKFFPFIEYKHFLPEQKEEAKTWVAANLN